ncbi:MAG: ribosome recycling factor [Myxococcales bacterium]|jgi:ribosome recycling factor|nr:ribosome recycling factor [Myxococcales bacterium]
MIQEVLEELQTSIGKCHEALRRDLSKLRTGRANAGLLELVRVDYYGQVTPIAQMATISVPEPRLLTVKPWEKSQVQAVEKAIRESDLGLNPQVDGDTIRVPVPPLSEERRRDLVKLAKKSGEECKVAIRHARHGALDMLNEMKTNGDASEDEIERAKKKVEEIVGQGVQNVDVLVQGKEKEILTV